MVGQIVLMMVGIHQLILVCGTHLNAWVHPTQEKGMRMRIVQVIRQPL